MAYAQKISHYRHIRYKSSIFSLLLLCIFLLVGCSTSTPAPSSGTTTLASTFTSDTAGSQTDTLLTQLVKNQQFSGSVFIARNGSILLRKGYGMADWTKSIPNTPHTGFYIGSLTKQFTAMAILLLQAQGKLHLQDPVCTYITPCPAVLQSILISQLLTHTSGLPRDLYGPSVPRPTTAQEALTQWASVKLSFAPGTQYLYSNLGYQILGYVIQAVAATSYAQFIQKAILKPLQMNASGFSPNYQSIATNAVGYAAWQIPAPPVPIAQTLEMSFLDADVGLYSTVEDLYRWDQALYTNTLLPQQALQTMFTPHITVCTGLCGVFTQESYGLGWYIGDESNTPQHVIWHDGLNNGFSSYLGRYPNEGVTIIILTNLRPIFATNLDLVHQIEKIVFA